MVGGDEAIGPTGRGGGDHEGIGQAERPVSGTEPGRDGRGGGVEVDHLGRQAVDHGLHDFHRGVAAPGRADEALRQRRRGKGQLIAVVSGVGEHGTSRLVVDVVGIEEADDDPGVEVDQSHSERRSSSSPGR